MEKSLLIILSGTEVGGLIPKIQEIRRNGEKVDVLLTDYFCRDRLVMADIKYKVPEDYVESSLVEGPLVEEAERMAYGWYKIDWVHEKLKYKGIELGPMTERLTRRRLIDLLRNITGIWNLVMHEKISNVYFAKTPRNEEMLRMILGNTGVTFVPIECEIQAEKANSFTEEVMKTLKRRKKSRGDSARNVVKKSGAKKVFIRGRGYLDSLTDALGKSPDFKVVSLDTFISDYYLNPINVLAKIFSNAAGGGKNQRKYYLQIWEKLKRDPEFKKLMSFEGKDVSGFMENHFRRIFSTELSRIREYIDMLEKLFEKEKPDIFVNWSDLPEVERAILMVARKNNVPSLQVEHGYVVNTGLQVKIMSDMMAMWGDIPKQWLVSAGADEKKLIVTGANLREYIGGKKFISKKEFCKKFSLDAEKGIALLATQHPTVYADSYSITRSTAETMKKIEGMQLIIKTHPAENPQPYRQIVKKIGSDAKVISDVGLHQVISVCDFMMVFGSTTSIEGMIMEKPVIGLEWGNKVKVPYAGSGAVLEIENEEGLIPAIKSLSGKKLRQNLEVDAEKFIRNYAGVQDGKANERIINLMREMISEGKRSN